MIRPPVDFLCWPAPPPKSPSSWRAHRRACHRYPYAGSYLGGCAPHRKVLGANPPGDRLRVKPPRAGAFLSRLPQLGHQPANPWILRSLLGKFLASCLPNLLPRAATAGGSNSFPVKVGLSIHRSRVGGLQSSDSRSCTVLVVVAAAVVLSVVVVGRDDGGG